jgi:hypothetical protein
MTTTQPAIDTEAVLLRVEALNSKGLVTVDQAYCLLYGSHPPHSFLRRTFRSFVIAIDPVVCPFVYAYYKITGAFDRSEDSYGGSISPEEAPPDAKPGEMLFAVSDLELWLRKCRTVAYHPLLGIELPIFKIGDDERISPADIALIVTGNKPLEYETGATNLFNGGQRIVNLEKGKALWRGLPQLRGFTLSAIRAVSRNVPFAARVFLWQLQTVIGLSSP